MGEGGSGRGRWGEEGGGGGRPSPLSKLSSILPILHPGEREEGNGAMGERCGRVGGWVEGGGGEDPVLSQSSLPFFLSITTSILERKLKVPLTKWTLTAVVSHRYAHPSLSLPPSSNPHLTTQTCAGVCSVSLGAAFSATVHIPQEEPE